MHPTINLSIQGLRAADEDAETARVLCFLYDAMRGVLARGNSEGCRLIADLDALSETDAEMLKHWGWELVEHDDTTIQAMIWVKNDFVPPKATRKRKERGS